MNSPFDLHSAHGSPIRRTGIFGLPCSSNFFTIFMIYERCRKFVVVVVAVGGDAVDVHSSSVLQAWSQVSSRRSYALRPTLTIISR